MIPINVDRNVGPAAYNSIADGARLLVTSIFYTFQGEGPYAGHPAIFLRLAGCNLGDKKACPWCDTRFNFDEGQLISRWELFETFRKLRGKSDLIVVTGGEPLLQWDTLQWMIDSISTTNPTQQPFWQFETNGILLTQEILEQARELGNVSFVVSPKIIAKNGAYQPLDTDWFAHRDIISLKYVVSADPDSPYHSIPDELNFLSWQVYVSGQTEYGPDDVPTLPGVAASIFKLSPEAMRQTARNYKHAAQIAMREGYRVSFQSHLFAGVE